MKTALVWLQLIPTLISAIVAIIPALDKLIPQSGQGAAKLELAKTILSEAGEAVTNMWPFIEKLISAFCAAKNAADAVTPPVDPTVIIP